MIAGGVTEISSQSGTTEVVELKGTITNSTPSFGTLPSKRNGAVGAMLYNNTPILCGGTDGSGTFLDSCTYFQNSQWNQSHSLNERREYAAGVEINSTTIWILGGQCYFALLDSTEYIIQGQTDGVPGPELPYGLRAMCAVKLSEHEIFVIGGMSDADESNHTYRNEVWIYDPQNGFNQTQGPSLNSHRSAHSCSIMNDGEMTFIIVAGGYNGVYLNSVEIYDPTNKTWTYGK